MNKYDPMDIYKMLHPWYFLKGIHGTCMKIEYVVSQQISKN